MSSVLFLVQFNNFTLTMGSYWSYTLLLKSSYAFLVAYVYMGRGFTSGGQKSGSVFSAAMCKLQASKRYVESLPLVLKDEEPVSLKVKGSLYSCLLIARLPSGSRMLNTPRKC